MAAVKVRPFSPSVYSSITNHLNRKISNDTTSIVKIPLASSRNKRLVSLCLSETSAKNVGFEANNAVNYSKSQEEEQQHKDEHVKSYGGIESNLDEDKNAKPKTYALIHDFCLGIPFGGIVFAGSIIGFLFSRNLASLTGSGLLGGSILALGFISLKVWRQGLSSLPFIFAQAALAATLFWHHLPLYSLTKKIFPSGFYVFMSAAMVCFYSYVIISGGSPPSKKITKKPAS